MPAVPRSISSTLYASPAGSSVDGNEIVFDSFALMSNVVTGTYVASTRRDTRTVYVSPVAGAPSNFLVKLTLRTHSDSPAAASAIVWPLFASTSGALVALMDID